jgi:hypothetical protein
MAVEIRGELRIARHDNPTKLCALTHTLLLLVRADVRDVAHHGEDDRGEEREGHDGCKHGSLLGSVRR